MLHKFKKSRQRERQYVRNALNKGRSHNVALERLFLKECVYCGEKATVVNGVDRIDNEIGYEVGNVVPACSTCNFMKGKLHFSDFLLHCEKIAAHAPEARRLIVEALNQKAV